MPFVPILSAVLYVPASQIIQEMHKVQTAVKTSMSVRSWSILVVHMLFAKTLSPDIIVFVHKGTEPNPMHKLHVNRYVIVKCIN